MVRANYVFAARWRRSGYKPISLPPWESEPNISRHAETSSLTYHSSFAHIVCGRIAPLRPTCSPFVAGMYIITSLQVEHAQLYLKATSSLLSRRSRDGAAGGAVSSSSVAALKLVEKKKDDEVEDHESGSGGWQHGEWEMGRRLVQEVVGGEEAAVREVQRSLPTELRHQSPPRHPSSSS